MKRTRWRLLRWFAFSLGGRYLHRAMHALDDSRACRFCRVVWWRVFEWSRVYALSRMGNVSTVEAPDRIVAEETA